ncbi:MAG: hypothetical protein A3G76_06945 [Acidobacteria bacterium RIFCSPLOWO2_12_FULL_65_11]|nr:MAG: hypothetical protein A3H95_12350 [Acidobacteria bacterium RIFCSPLOWO2_02_FULL_64_15]OFW34329.1 MAG: hypothetical protein A3G76_06945 [Acidobacteria bacterium RIFCSPLOWO2_12_FULL_65_11]
MTLGLRDEASKRVRVIRESGVRSFTRSVRAQQPDAMLWGALESCPEGDDWRRALHALCAMRRMCHAAQTRDTNIRLPKSRVNLVLSAEVRTSFPGHHTSATSELRGGAVKTAARGVERSESLDGAEHSSIVIM